MDIHVYFLVEPFGEQMNLRRVMFLGIKRILLFSSEYVRSFHASIEVIKPCEREHTTKQPRRREVERVRYVTT